MYQIDFHKPLHIHFIGIGGISMSGLAEILLGEDFVISGSDSKSSPLTQALEKKGATIYYGQRATNITDDVDVVVYTAAIHPDNPEFACAKEKGLPMLTRAELLGQIMRNYDTPVAISGTHGKTTTTSMVSHILLAGDCDPTISVGGILPAIGGNIRVGNSETFVTEACEYTNSFLSFFPKISIILNMDADHLDFFKDIDDIRHSFRRFAELLPADGTLIINADTPKYEDIIRDLPCNVITYGLEHDADYQAADITYDKYGHASFSVLRNGVKVGSYYLKVPGIHNVSNALAAIAAAKLSGVSNEDIVAVLTTFSGVRHRLQYVMDYQGRRFYNDSKSTDIEATEVALQGFEQPVILLAGGLDRGYTFERLVPYFKKHVKAIIVFGECKQQMKDAAEQAGIAKIVETENAITAVPEAWKLSEPGDVILLSPANASWDQFPSFEVRGDKFIKAVEELTGQKEQN